MNSKDAVVSLFSGAGGMSLGFVQAGVKPMLAADIDNDACCTYRSNLDVDAIEVDLAIPSEHFEKELDRYYGAFVLIGGPPCQGFSSAGRKNGGDVRNRLIFEYLSCVARLNPRWFLFENVEGILTSNEGMSIRDLVMEFIRLGYQVRLEKVNFATYGLPQGRKRIVLVGNRIGVRFNFPTATHSFDAGKHRKMNGHPLAPSVETALRGLGRPVTTSDMWTAYESSMPLNDYDARMRTGNADSNISLHCLQPVPHRLAEILPRLRPGCSMKDLPQQYWSESYKRRAFRRVMDGTPTAKRGGAPSGVKRLVGNRCSLTITSAATREFVHPIEHRFLTMRECARLQSFPDAFTFIGSPTSIGTQIGNAFPPLAALVFARHLMQLDGTFGAGTSSRQHGDSGLLGYHLTDSTGMSPVLAKTDSHLRELMSTPQLALALFAAVRGSNE